MVRIFSFAAGAVVGSRRVRVAGSMESTREPVRLPRALVVEVSIDDSEFYRMALKAAAAKSRRAKSGSLLAVARVAR